MDNFEKLWLQARQNELAINRATQEIQRQGRRLPCRVTAVTGSIVTVEFQVDTSPWTLAPVSIPKAESPWVRMPTQVGDLGYTQPADTYLGGVSGLGGGTANLTRRGNLTALVFVPVSNSGSPPDNPNAAQICGPDGAIIRTTTGTTSSVVTNTSGTTVTFGSNTIVVNESEASITVGTTTLTVSEAGISMTAGGQTFTWGGTGAESSMPITAPDVILPNGPVNGHYHYVPGTPGNSEQMTG